MTRWGSGVLPTFLSLCAFVELLFKLVCVVLFTVMITVVFYEVVMRHVFNAPSSWAEPLARTAMIWMVLLELAIGISSERIHLR